MPSRLFSRRHLGLSVYLFAAGVHTLPGATLYWIYSGAGGSSPWREGSVNWTTDAAGTDQTHWSNAGRDIAAFRGAAVPNQVVVDGPVSAGALHFTSGTHTLSGSPIVLGRLAGTGHFTFLNSAAGTGAITISNNLVVHDAGTVGANINYLVTHAGSEPLTLNGDLSVDYGDQPPSGAKAFAFQTGNAQARIVLNGNLGPGAPGATASKFSVIFGHGGTTRANADALNGTFHLNGTSACARTSVNGGTIVVGHDQAFGSGSLSLGNSGSRGKIALLTEGPRTLANAITISGASSSQVYVGVTTTHETTFRGDFNLTGFGTAGTGSSLGTLGNPDPIFTAVAGAKLNLEGALGAAAAIPRGLVKQGPGIVSLASARGNNFKGLVAVNEGTLLLMNTAGSATGDASQLPPGAVAVLVDARARLGGTGTASRLVGAAASTSAFAPGNMSRDGVSSVGTLNLLGGLVAKNGATFAFDINGATIDQLNFGAAPLDLRGVVTVQFTAVGGVQTSMPYRLLIGTGDWSSSAPEFVFHAPAGYALDPSYGDGKGYVFDPSARSLTVRFESLPAPSAYSPAGHAAPR